MKTFLFLFGIIICLNLKAQDESDTADSSENNFESPSSQKSCEFNVVCSQNQSSFTFEYRVLGGGCDDNGAGDLILVSEAKRFPLQFKGLPLKNFEDVGNLEKICEIDGRKYPAVEISENRIALFVRVDNRPSLDRLGAIIVDLKKKKVIKVEPNFGEIKNHSFALLKSGRNFKTQLVKDAIKGVNCDCDAAYTDGWKEITAFDVMFKTKWIK